LDRIEEDGMQDVLRALNQLVSGGEIEDYAIGGAVGASF
jgi:hypothetical protein